MRVLVIGGDQSIGAKLAEDLDKKHDILCYCPDVPPFVPSTERADKWIDGTLYEPADSLDCVRLIGEPVDVVIHCPMVTKPLRTGVLTTFDFTHEYALHVIEPLMLIRYMIEFDAIKQSGHAIFMDSPPQTWGPENMAGVTAKGSYEGAILRFSQDFPYNFGHTIVKMPLINKPGSDEAVIDKIIKQLDKVENSEDPICGELIEV